MGWSSGRLGVGVVLAGCVLLLCGVASVAASEPDRAEALERAWDRYDRSDAAGARAEFVRLLRARTSDLAAADGVSEMDRARCRLEDFLSLIENPELSSDWAEAPACAAFLSGIRRQQERRYGEALADFERAADAALAADDTLSALAALRRAGFCGLRDGDATATMRVAERAGALATGSAGTLRQVLEVEKVRAGWRNLSSRLIEADSIYAGMLERAEAADLTLLTATALNGRGTIGSKQRQPGVSLPFYRRAEQIVRDLGDVPRLTMILKNAGYDHTQAREIDAALACYEEARALADECGLPQYLGHIHTGFGAAAEVLGDREGAIRHFTDSYLAHASTGELRGELGARQRLAYNLMISGRYTEAATHYGRCLEIIEERGNDYLLNWVLGGLALTNHKLGRLDEAERYYLQAREVDEALGDRTSVAWCHLYLGWLEMQRGNYRKALLRSHEAREIYRDLDDAEGIGDAHAVMAEVHFRLGAWDEARDHYETAARIGEEHHLGELLNRAYHGLAEVCSAAGLPGEARRYCERALRLAREWSDANGIIWALLELAEQSIDEGELEAARRHLAAATSRLDPTAHFDFRSRARLLQARCAGRPRDAVGLAAEALTLARDGGRPELEWSALSDLGEYHLAAGDTAAARAAQEQAIRVVESLRRAVGADELRRHMMRPALVPYERMVHLVLGGGAPSEHAARQALAITERSRAQILAARLQSTGALGPSGGALHAGVREQEHLASIAYMQSQLQRADLAEDERRRLRDEVARLEEEIQYLRLGAEVRDGPPPPADAPRIEPTGVLAPREEALSYFLGERGSYLFHITPQGVAAHRLPPRPAIEERVRRYLSLRSGPAVPGEILDGAERTLHDLLLGPVATSLGPGTVLVIVPDGILHRLPFATLRGPQGRLVERHETFVTPSLRTLVSLREREAKRRAAGDSPELAILAVGCGEAGANGADATRRVHPFDNSPVASLLGAKHEAQQVAGLFERALVLTGAAADEAGFKAAPLHEAEVLHIAAHSYADEREARRSYVLMNSARSAQGAAAVEDDLLQWGEAAALELNASLVTLASCRSAGGVLSVGEGVTGLTQAFLFAGGTCVLASQADIGDEYSRRFMLSFYEQLRRGETASRALLRVQLQSAQAPDPGSRRDPWADFVLIGDGSVTLSSAVGGGLTPLELGLLITAVVLCIALPVFSLVRRRRSG